MTNLFGDLEPDDVIDDAPADPFQMAVRFHRLRLAHGLEGRGWLELDDHDRAVAIAVIEDFLALWRREGLH